MEPDGTDFQEAVWDALVKIPYGQTASYGQIAQAVGSPNGARAVGMACNRNPIMIAVPCHRVVGADGQLVGYALGMEMKQALLTLERTGTIQK
jgi:O-6-methylguanine DNA methyltransferase